MGIHGNAGKDTQDHRNTNAQMEERLTRRKGAAQLHQDEAEGEDVHRHAVTPAGSELLRGAVRSGTNTCAYKRVTKGYCYSAKGQDSRFTAVRSSALVV